MVNALLNRKNIIASLVLLSFGVCAESGTAWDLDNLQKQRVLYEAKAAVNKAKADADTRDYGTSTTTSTVLNGNSQVASLPSGDVLPQLVKINGKNAVISTPDGNTSTVSAGQLLPGGRWQVLSVGLSGIKIKNIASQRTQVIN